TEHRANVRRADQAEAAWRQSLSLAVAEVTRLTKLKPGAPCSECTREMTLEHIESAIATAQAQANRVEESAQLRVWEALRAEPDELNVDSAAGIRSAYTKARVLLDTARAQDRDMANLRKLWEVKARDLPKLRQQSEQLHARGLELEARRAALHVQAPISEPSHDELTALRRGLREREDMAAVQSGRMNRLIGELDAMQSQWQQLSDELVQALETSATVNGLVAASRTHAELDTAYAELRTTLNARVRPELASTASQIMSELTHGRYTGIDLDDGYNLSVLDGGEPKPVISGGEEDVASLAVRLSISSMIAQRSGRPVSLLLLDEIFGSLDDERRDSVIALLRQLQGRFEQVVLITHVEGIQDSVDQLVRVEWDERSGASIARVA
ncbi:MAG: ATP-binding protein, partial [Longimicrobiales bacterium]